jgi:hypothetical protein
MLMSVSKYCDRNISFGPRSAQLWILVEFNHFLNNLIVTSIQVHLIVIVLSLVATLLDDPLFFIGVQVPLKSLVILANNSLDRVEVTIADIVRAFGNASWSFDVVCD